MLRALSFSANSYVEVWSWGSGERELVAVIDKTFLGL
jgi:hypothetical protein